MRAGPPWPIPGPQPHQVRGHPGVQRARPGSVCGAGAGAGAGPGPGQRARGQAGPSLQHGCSLAPVRPGQQPQVKSNSQGAGGALSVGAKWRPYTWEKPQPITRLGFGAYAEERSALGLWRAMKRWGACHCPWRRRRETCGGQGPEDKPPCHWVLPGKSLSSEICTSWRLEEGKKQSWVFRKRHTGFSGLGCLQKAASGQGAVKCGMFSLLSPVLGTLAS